ncbi:MAG: DUF3786 domain-containing protein [Bacillota bacterium]|nr:DUF3786 domain-containing protein [Bacillota bacterium]
MSENNYRDALGKARYEFGLGDPLLMADCSGAVYQELGDGKGIFRLTYLNKEYEITFPAGEVSFAKDTIPVAKDKGTDDCWVQEPEAELKVESPAAKVGCGRPIPQAVPIDYSGNTILVSDQTLMLMYLKQASGLPLREQWLNFLQLPEGSHHYGPFLVDAVNPMVELFHDNKELFFKAVAGMGGKAAKLGDFGAIIPALPRIPLAFLVWEGDEEFPPKGGILFDDTISTNLDTAGAYVLGINAARRLMAIGKRLR